MSSSWVEAPKGTASMLCAILLPPGDQTVTQHETSDQAPASCRSFCFENLKEEMVVRGC